MNVSGKRERKRAFNYKPVVRRFVLFLPMRVGDIVHQTCLYFNDKRQRSEVLVNMRVRVDFSVYVVKRWWTFHVADRQQG